MKINHPIIDIHCHTAGTGSGNSGCFVSSALRKNMRYRFFLKAFGISETELEQCGDAIVLERLSLLLQQSQHVSAAVVLAMDGVIDSQGNMDYSRTEIHVPNEFLALECRNFPNILFGASINPYRRDALDRLEQAVHQGAVLLKWLPSIQGIDPNNSLFTSFYRRMQELQLPLLTHTGNEESFTRTDNRLADPQRLLLPLKMGVTVIAAHCASNGNNEGQQNLMRLLPLFDEFPNLYADISSLTQLNRIGHLPRILRNSHLHNRLLYGSDMPIIATGITSPWFHSYHLPLRQTRTLAAIANPWDRDVMLKQSLGMPMQMFGNSARLLKITGR